MFFGARYLESEILEWYRLSRVLYITTSDTSPIANTVICYQWKNTVIVIFAPMWGCASVRCHCPPVNLCPVSVIEMSTVQCIFWNDSKSCEQPKDFCTINIKHWLENLLIHSSHLIVDCPTHYSTGLRLDFHLFLDLTKRTQEGNLLHLIFSWWQRTLTGGQMLQCCLKTWVYAEGKRCRDQWHGIDGFRPMCHTAPSPPACL